MFFMLSTYFRVLLTCSQTRYIMSAFASSLQRNLLGHLALLYSGWSHGASCHGWWFLLRGVISGCCLQQLQVQKFFLSGCWSPDRIPEVSIPGQWKWELLSSLHVQKIAKLNTYPRDTHAYTTQYRHTGHRHGHLHRLPQARNCLQ